MAGDLLEDGYIKCGETELIEKINSLYNPVDGSMEIFKLGETGISIGKLEEMPNLVRLIQISFYFMKNIPLLIYLKTDKFYSTRFLATKRLK